MKNLNKYIITTVEGDTYAPNGDECEHCQMLGFSFGKDPEDAIDRLFKDCQWLGTSGFEKTWCDAFRLHDDENIR